MRRKVEVFGEPTDAELTRRAVTSRVDLPARWTALYTFPEPFITQAPGELERGLTHELT